MRSNITKPDSVQPGTDTAGYLFDDWFDPIEAQVRERVRGFIRAMIEGELEESLQRPRYGRRSKSCEGEPDSASTLSGHRHGHRTRLLTGTFGELAIAVPRARLAGSDGQTTEWNSKVLRTYQRRTLAADALIASAYLAGTNTRRVRRALRTWPCAGEARGAARGPSRRDLRRRWWRRRGRPQEARARRAAILQNA